MELKIDEKCIGCGACVTDCPVGVLALADGRPAVRADKADRCMNCRHCLAVCPVGALTLDGVSAEDNFTSSPQKNQPLTTNHQHD